MKNRQLILELAQEMRELKTNCNRWDYRIRRAGELMEDVVDAGLFSELKFIRLRKYSDPEYPRHTHSHFSVFLVVTDWIHNHPGKFSFDVPEFYTGTSLLYGENATNISKINIPALAKVIEMQCEAMYSKTLDAESSTQGESAQDTLHGSDSKLEGTVEERALQQLVINPHWNKKQIAEQIGCPSRSLAKGRCPKLHSAMQAYQQRNLPKGSKSHGKIEAIDEG